MTVYVPRRPRRQVTAKQAGWLTGGLIVGSALLISVAIPSPRPVAHRPPAAIVEPSGGHHAPVWFMQHAAHGAGHHPHVPYFLRPHLHRGLYLLHPWRRHWVLRAIIRRFR